MVKHTQLSAGIVSGMLALVMTGIILWHGPLLHAQATICGDGVLEGAEQCDDGNLSIGDGCSNLCTIEVCGNGIVDPGEQCDGPGSLPPGQGCDASCFITFCGDGLVQAELGETCDDGNALPEDGCDAQCHLELTIPLDVPEAVIPTQNLPPPLALSPLSPPSQSTQPLHEAPPPSPTQAFLTSPEGQQLLAALDPALAEALTSILNTLDRGGPLTEEQQLTALALADAIEAYLRTQRSTLLDLLRRFIGTPISAGVVNARHLDASRLTDVELQAILEELRRVPRLSPAAIERGIDTALANLRLLDPSLSGLPANFLSLSPLEQFVAIQLLKESLERTATTDVPASLRILEQATRTMRESITAAADSDPALRNPAIPAAIDALASAVESAAPDQTTQLVRAERQLTQLLPPTDDTALRETLSSLHAAAPALAERSGATGALPDPRAQETFIRALASEAPARAKTAFERGDTRAQAEALRYLLSEDPDVQRLLADVTNAPELHDTLLRLQIAIDVTGTPAAGSVPCSSTIRDLTRCIDDFLVSLETASRERSVVTRTIHRIRTFFTFSSDGR